MISAHLGNLSRRVLWIAALVALVCGLQGRPAPAAEALKKLDVSLRWIPEDAAFYSTMLRNAEQIEAAAKSRAWKSLIEMPVVKQGIKTFRAKLEENENADQIKEAWENPEVRSALELLGDMFSHEVFVYGDRDSVDSAQLLQSIAGAMRWGPMFLQLTGRAERMNPQKMQATLLLSALAEHRELIKVPGAIVGFRLKDTQPAKDALVKLEMAFNIGSVAVPQLAGALKRTKVAGNEYLTLTLKGEMVPWESIPTEELEKVEAEKGDAQKVIDRLKKLTLVIALGVRDNYLLVSIGPSTDHLARLGQGKSLADRPEFKPLEKYADRRLVDIGYLSKPFAATLVNDARHLEELVKRLDKALNDIDLTTEQKAQIRKDSAALAKDLKRLMPDRGAMMSFDFLMDRGMEGYAYAWGNHPTWNASKRLGLLEHVGGSPLLMLVARGRVSVEDYDLMVRWAKTGYRYFEEYGLPNMPSSEREKFDQAVKKFRPLVERFDRANRTLLIPALADGQAGLVLDAGLKSRQFVKSLPATEATMPMAEPAIVLGVSNAELLRKGLAEQREIFNASVDAIRELSPGDVPDFKIPQPNETKTSAGTLYWFTLPEEWGVTEEVKIVLGIADQVMVVGVTQAQAERLLKSTPLAVGGVLAAVDRPLAAAVAVNWEGIVNAATPWAEFATRQALKDKPQAAKPAAKAKKGTPAKKGEPKKGKAKKAPARATVVDQVHTALKVLKVIRAVTVEGYREDNAMVHHTLVEIRDID